MTKTKTKNAAAAPAIVVTANVQGEQGAAPSPQGEAIATKGEPVQADIRKNYVAAMEEKMQRKTLLLSTAKQALAHAHDVQSDGEALTGEASRLADTASGSLYQARIDGLATPAELSALLGDIYGYKPKSDGTPGKTPAGQGEAIRKRVVRAVGAAEYVTNGDGGKFFIGLPEDEVRQVVAELDNGNCSIFTAYDRLADIKREHTSKTEIAFNADTIAKIAMKLGEEGSADIVLRNPDLVAAYSALTVVMDAIFIEG